MSSTKSFMSVAHTIKKFGSANIEICYGKTAITANTFRPHGINTAKISSILLWSKKFQMTSIYMILRMLI